MHLRIHAPYTVYAGGLSDPVRRYRARVTRHDALHDYGRPARYSTHYTLYSILTILTIPAAKQDFSHWYRDPEQPVPFNQITRFPHAVLEVKLCLPQDDLQPQWVSDLISSDMLLEVHKVGGLQVQ
jgi:hypothetical protein